MKHSLMMVALTFGSFSAVQALEEDDNSEEIDKVFTYLKKVTSSFSEKNIDKYSAWEPDSNGLYDAYSEAAKSFFLNEEETNPNKDYIDAIEKLEEKSYSNTPEVKGS